MTKELIRQFSLLLKTGGCQITFHLKRNRSPNFTYRLLKKAKFLRLIIHLRKNCLSNSLEWKDILDWFIKGHIPLHFIESNIYMVFQEKSYIIILAHSTLNLFNEFPNIYWHLF